MMLTEEQKKIVGANMGLVGRVIQDKIHGEYQLGIYTYDDIFQIGCIGLCKAAATDKGGCFSTYAYRVIWNEICSALIYASRRSATELTIDPELMDVPEPPDLGVMEFEELSTLLDAAEKEAKGVTASPDLSGGLYLVKNGIVFRLCAFGIYGTDDCIRKLYFRNPPVWGTGAWGCSHLFPEWTVPGKAHCGSPR